MTYVTDLLMVVVNSANKVTGVVASVTGVTETDAETLAPGGPATDLLLLVSSNMQSSLLG